MPNPHTLESLAPHLVPTDRTARTLLRAIRRMAANGLTDAHAANAMLGAFGLQYRRPLMFLRVMMQEVSRVSQQKIAIAPCCCPRMTENEGAFLLAIDMARDHPDIARTTLARVTGSLDLLPAISIAQALGDALDDIGRPISL